MQAVSAAQQPHASDSDLRKWAKEGDRQLRTKGVRLNDTHMTEPLGLPVTRETQCGPQEMSQAGGRGPGETRPGAGDAGTWGSPVFLTRLYDVPGSVNPRVIKTRPQNPGGRLHLAALRITASARKQLNTQQLGDAQVGYRRTIQHRAHRVTA